LINKPTRDEIVARVEIDDFILPSFISTFIKYFYGKHRFLLLGFGFFKIYSFGFYR
jgi:hypothetical protein